MNQNLGLVVGPHAELEALAIRSTAEYFGYKVLTHWLGRPQNFVEFLNGKLFDEATKTVVLCFHGDQQRLVMPKLAKDAYWDGEPTCDFGPEQFRNNALNNKLILTTACGLGQPEIGSCFQNVGARFIAPESEVEGNNALMFVHSFLFYSLSTNNDLAFELSNRLHDESNQFVMFS